MVFDISWVLEDALSLQYSSIAKQKSFVLPIVFFLVTLFLVNSWEKSGSVYDWVVNFEIQITVPLPPTDS